MSNNPAGLLAVFAYVGTVLASVPVAVVALLLRRITPSFREALAYSLGGGFALFTVVVLALAVAVDPGAGGTLFVTGVVAVVVLAVLPLAIGRAVVERTADLDPDRALRWATAGWPPAMILSLIVFVAPGGPARYNVTFLSGVEAVVAGGILVAVVLLGPGLVGTALARAFE
ncbi:hypothetical protein BRD00_01835 [Halobacteriales archaeon QS_8_69_26]|nr:MAG: hypothetical protein BRD00_01835 [Halobacteriales archaeon QS_8_69_26]